MSEESTPLRHIVRRLRFRHLELLAFLETAGTVRAAADLMQLTQPAITRMIQEIEAIFETPLFERSARGIAPNAQGVKLIAHAVALINELDGTRREIALSSTQLNDLLRIGAFSGARNLSLAYARLIQSHPHVRIEIREQVISELLDALLRGELDCLFGSLPPEELKQRRMDTLRIQQVGQEHVSVVAARDSPWAKRRRIGWAELQNARWALPPRDSLLRRAFIRVYLDLGLTPPEPAVEAISPLTIRSMLEFGGAELGLARSGHAAEDVRLGVLRELPMTTRLSMPPLAVFTRRAAGTRRRLVEAMTQALRDVGAQS